MSRTIKIDMTWQAAAQIIAAALENGTDTGRDAARAELFRMAAILDQLRQAEGEKPPASPLSVDLWEVIAEPIDRTRPAFGQTFAEEAPALSYARAMRRAGYSADVSPVFHTQATAAEALEQAANFYDDRRLSEGRA